MNKPTIGQIVHYVLRQEDSFCAGDHRPAIITNIFTDADGKMRANMMVTLDPANDNRGLGVSGLELLEHRRERTHLDCYSVPYSETKEPGTWHWPEREEAPGPPESFSVHIR